MKKLVLLGLVLSANAWAADSSLAITSCTIKNGATYCTLGPNGVIQSTNNNTAPSTTGNQLPQANVADPQKSIEALANVQQNQGQYNSKVPGGNSFIFCMGGRPSKYSPMRPVYDNVCDSGDASKVKAPPVPVLIDPDTGKPVDVNNQINLNPVGVAPPVVKNGVVVSGSGNLNLTASQQEQINLINSNNLLTPEQRQEQLSKILGANYIGGVTPGTAPSVNNVTPGTAASVSVFK